MAATHAAEEDKAGRRVPGEEGLWVLIFGDLMVFGVFFLTVLYYRSAEAEVFAQSQPALDRGLGLINTALLLTSSLLVAIGTHRVRTARRRAPLLFAGTILCGLCFVGVKALEYGEEFHAGIGPMTNDFFMLYFAFTGIHLAHVLVGLAALTYLTVASRRQNAAGDGLMLIECCAIFWHLVDLLWLVLFSLFYLMR